VHFAPTIADIKEFIPGPDMGTNELALGWIKDETGRAGGVPREAGGIPLHEIGSKGISLHPISDKVEVSVDFPDKAFSFSAALAVRRLCR
jgi:hypothetical protein